MSKIMNWLRRVARKMFPRKKINEALGVRIMTSTKMDQAIAEWLAMYRNEAPWLGGKNDVKSLSIPASVAEEFSRLVLTEFTFDLSGSERADFINSQMKSFVNNLDETVEYWAALGGIVLKPYVAQVNEAGIPEKIKIDVTKADRFFPTAFEDDEVTGAIFVETKRTDDYLFTRIEYHNMSGTDYTVVNKAYRSERLFSNYESVDTAVQEQFSEEIPLTDIEEWSGLAPEVTIHNLTHPLFVYVKVPRANTIDTDSPIGVSVYGRATDIIEEADRQFSSILWEYEAKEAAVDIDEELFPLDDNGNPIPPRGKERLYRAYDAEGKNDGFYSVYSPEIRDDPMFRGLDEYLRRIEFLVGLAYGTLSNPTTVEKTATEVKQSKQRSYTVVSKMQRRWDNALNELIEVMNELCDLYNIVPAGITDPTVTWGDGILEDTDVEFQRRWAMVVSGKMKLEKFYAWYFGCSEKEALDFIPNMPGPEFKEEE